ncbi:MAG TPA: flagellar hook-length control protein FliK [Caulobacter sp.]|nr:flagellar hook-length control protein FliK [Caulobacter sp.]
MSLFAGLVQPAARAAMGDAVGAGLSGFDALLAMLSQSLAAGGETPDREAALADAAPADGETAEGGTATPAAPAGESAMADWLAAGGDSAVVAQALGNPNVPPSKTSSDQPLEGAPETCAPPAQPSVDAAPGLAPSPDRSAPEIPSGETDQPLQWGGAPPRWSAGRSETDIAATLARVRESAAGPPAGTSRPPQRGDVPVGASSVEPTPVELPSVEAPPVETTPQPPGVAADPVQAAKAAASVIPAAAQPAAAPPPDPRAPGPRKPTAAASAAAELKTGRQDGPAADSDKAAPVETAAAVAEVTPDAPPQEPEVAPVQTRQAERPDTVTQALISRLESVAAGATALAAQVRGAPETVAKLAAGILDRLEGQATRFDLELDPHGLGKVEVRVEIGADGRLTAQLGFDNAQGLAELRGRAQELRQALEQAGFSLTENSLSFDFAGQQRRQDGQPDTAAQTSAGQAFARALGLADDEADPAPIRYQARRGLDLLV